MRWIKKTLLLFFLVLFICLGYGIYYLLFTSNGSRFIVEHALQSNALTHNIVFESVEGNLLKGVRFKGLRLKGLKELPQDSELTAGDLYLKVSSPKIEGLTVDLKNARLKLPVSDIIVPSGSLVQGEIVVALQSDALDLHEAARYFLKDQDIKQWQGLVKQLDAKIYGHYTTPALSARFLMTGIKDLPESSELKVQSLYVKAHSFTVDGLEVWVRNARLKMPVSDPVVLDGSFQNGKLAADIYGTSIDVSEISGYIPKNPHTRHLHGQVKQFDSDITGDYTSPVVTGSMMITEMDNRQVTIKESPTQFNLHCKDFWTYFRLTGDVAFDGGQVVTKRSAIQLKPSKLHYNGNPENPNLEMNGETVIGKVNIFIGIKGTMQEPSIHLSSDPPLSQQELLVMVATGKRWEGFSESVTSGSVTPRLTKDFVEYMFLGGRGNKMAERLGLTDFSLNVGPDSRGIGASKHLRDGVEINYEVERKDEIDVDRDRVTQKLGSEIRLTNRVTLDLKKEFRSDDETELEDEDIERAEIMLKYKKRF